MSQCRSLGSNYHPSSQTRKISIGIVVDQSAKIKPNGLREDAAATVPVTGRLGSGKVNTTDDTHKNDKVRDPGKEKQTEAAVPETSPKVGTRSVRQHEPSSQGGCDAKQPSSPLLNQCQRYNGANNSQQNSRKFASNQRSDLQSDDGFQFNRKKGRRDSSSNRVEDGLFATAQELKVPVKDVVQDKLEDTEKNGNESLRTKIWEVLGTVSTPTKQFSNSQTIKTGTEIVEPQQKSDEGKNSNVKPRQNSDTIESDSDGLNHTIKRPVTRSLTRKRPMDVQQQKSKNATSSSDKREQLGKNIFSFEEGWSRRITSSTNGGSSASKSGKKKSSGIEPRKLHFSKRNYADDTLQVTDSGKMKDRLRSTSRLKNSTGRFCDISLKKNSDSYHSPSMKKTDKLGNNYASVSPKDVDEKEELVDPSLKNIVEPQSKFNTSTVRMNGHTETCDGGSSPKNNRGKQEDVHSPMKEVLNKENFWSFKSLFASKPDGDTMNKETDIYDNEVEHTNFAFEKSPPNLKNIETPNSPSTSSSEEDGSKSCDESSPTEGPSEADTSDIVRDQEPETLLRPTKRCRINEGAAAALSPSTTSPKVSQNFHGLPSELNEENGLARAISLFAMVLERVKSKMKSLADKRSAEILTSVAMEMHLQLQNAESQIQKDVRKLNGIGKTERRRLENKFQEQQEQLKDIYERFKNEVNLHLQDCRSTLEGIESQQTEFKDILEKQKASHAKLLLQTEEAIETQLNDAQRNITIVHKSARQKMLQLKYVIAECLKEDVLC